MSKVNTNSSEFDKAAVIKKELTLYRRIFKDLDNDKKKVVEKLYTQAAYMSATLQELQIKIDRDGPIGKFVNGNGFEIEAENPAQISYNKMIRNYTTTMKVLMAELPKEVADPAAHDDELTAFLKGHKK